MEEGSRTFIPAAGGDGPEQGGLAEAAGAGLDLLGVGGGAEGEEPVAELDAGINAPA